MKAHHCPKCGTPECTLPLLPTVDEAMDALGIGDKAAAGFVRIVDAIIGDLGEKPERTIFDPIPCGHASKLGAILSGDEPCAWCLNIAAEAKVFASENTIKKLRKELVESDDGWKDAEARCAEAEAKLAQLEAAARGLFLYAAPRDSTGKVFSPAEAAKRERFNGDRPEMWPFMRSLAAALAVIDRTGEASSGHDVLQTPVLRTDTAADDRVDELMRPVRETAVKRGELAKAPSVSEGETPYLKEALALAGESNVAVIFKALQAAHANGLEAAELLIADEDMDGPEEISVASNLRNKIRDLRVDGCAHNRSMAGGCVKCGSPGL